jgi:hypothetical protein
MNLKTLLKIFIVIYILLSPLILTGIIINYLFANYIYPYLRDIIKNNRNNRNIINTKYDYPEQFSHSSGEIVN